MRSDPATLDVAQRMRETLGQDLHPGLGNVVGGVARRADHRLREGMDAVDDAPEIDRKHALPALVMVEGASTGRGAGVVHQHVDRAEGAIGAILEAIYLIYLADVSRHGDELGAGQ